MYSNCSVLTYWKSQMAVRAIWNSSWCKFDILSRLIIQSLVWNPWMSGRRLEERIFIQSSYEVVYSFNWCMTLRMAITNQSPSMWTKRTLRRISQVTDWQTIYACLWLKDAITSTPVSWHVDGQYVEDPQKREHDSNMVLLFSFFLAIMERKLLRISSM